MRIDTDPLGAIRKELVGAARRRTAARRRRRRAVTAAATAMLTAVAVTGTGVATGLGPDLGAIGSALESLVSINENASPPDPEARVLREEQVPRVPGVPELGLSTADRSEVIEFPWGDSAEPAYALAFAGGLGDICYSVAAPGQFDSKMRHAQLQCLPAKEIARGVGGEEGIAFGQVIGTPTVVLGGYVSPEVVKAKVIGPWGGELEVHLTETWRPSVDGAGPLRVFAAIHQIATEGDGFAAKEAELALALADYQMRLTFDDGRTVERQFRWGG